VGRGWFDRRRNQQSALPAPLLKRLEAESLLSHAQSLGDTATKSSRGNVDVRLHVTRLTRTARHLRVVSQVPAVRQASDGLKQHLT